MALSIGGTYLSGSAGTLQYSGLTSQTNWVDVVDKLMTIERLPITQLNSWKTEWSDKITALQGLDARLLILETQSGDMSSPDEFYSRTSSSSNEHVATVTSTNTATPGAHTLTVGSDIPHRLAAQGWADKNMTPLGDGGGDMVIRVGNYGTITISGDDITAGTTLQDLCNLINTDPENTGGRAVTASIIDDGSTINPYRLIISATYGGPDYQISVINNPTSLNFYENGIAPPDTSNLTAATTTTISAMGSFAGDKSILGPDGYRTYTFTGPASQETLGSGDWSISWVGDHGGGSSTINLGASYAPGDTIEIEEGVYIRFDAGTFEGGNKTFTVKAYANDINDPELGTWSGTSAVSADGNYLGSTTKTFNFTISGTGTKTIGTDSFDVTWTDGEGHSGTIRVTPDSYADLSVYQGVRIGFGSGTVQGGDTFSINVSNPTLQAGVAEGLAKAEIETHSGFVDETTSAVTSAEGTFSYTYGGVARTLTVPAGSTLANLRDLINSDEGNPGVTAAIINDGSGLSTAYHLQLIGNDTGAAHTIESIRHTLDNFAKGGTTGFGFSESQKAQNAMVRVDGYPPGNSEYLQRDSNTIGDLVSGVTMSLGSPGTTTISITTDNTAIKGKIQTFVDSINSVLDYIKQMTAYDKQGSGKNNGPMIGNYAFQIVQQRLNTILSNPIPGLTNGVDRYTSLAQIGIHTDPDQGGKWVIDEVTLDNALNKDLQGVSKLFVRTEDTGADGVAKLVEDEASKLTSEYADANPGIVAVLIHNYEGIIQNIDAKIEREDRRLALVESRLNKKFSQLEVILGQLQGQTEYLKNLINSLPQLGGKK